MCQSTLPCKNGLSCSTIPLLILILPFTILILLLFAFTQTSSGTICVFPTIFSSVGMFSLSDFWKLSLTCEFFSTCYSLLCPPTHLLCPCRLVIISGWLPSFPTTIPYSFLHTSLLILFPPSSYHTHSWLQSSLSSSQFQLLFLSSSSCSNCKRTLEQNWAGTSSTQKPSS